VELVVRFPVLIGRCESASDGRFRSEATDGRAEHPRRTCSGVRGPVRDWRPSERRLQPHPVDASEMVVLPELGEGRWGVAGGDRTDGLSRLAADPRAVGLALLAPYRSAKRDPNPSRSRVRSRIRSRIDTSYGQRVERVWARDRWQLGSRPRRTVRSHTIAVLLTVQAGTEPLHPAGLLT
jgi:hypothetical protein